MRGEDRAGQMEIKEPRVLETRDVINFHIEQQKLAEMIMMMRRKKDRLAKETC